MKLVLNEPRYLKDPISVISELVNEVKLKIKKDRIELIAMDPANVAMVVFNLLNTVFSEYEVGEEEELAVNLDNFKNILKRAKPSDTLVLELEGNKLNITIKGETTRTFSLSLINVQESEQKVPNLDFPLKMEINNILFNEAIDDMDIVSDSVAFAIKNNKFLMETKGNFSKANIELESGNEINISSNVDDVKARYSLEYIKKMIKASKLTNSVAISFSKDYPLKMEYIVKDKLSLSFLLAPRVSND